MQQFLARVRVVGRLARVIAVGVAHHVTQRGNGRRFLLESDADRRVYLDLLRENLTLHEVQLVGHCLMSNHVHLIVIPADAEGLALSMKHTHGRYASYWSVIHNSSGHAWQGRYFSCPLDAPHLWEALRYTELNPVRAQLVTEAHAWGWSSAAAHCATAKWNLHDSEMESQGRGSVSPLRTRRRNKVTRPEEDRTLKQWG